jgi:P4 family phage/plasmid primase-like protien
MSAVPQPTPATDSSNVVHFWSGATGGAAQAENYMRHRFPAALTPSAGGVFRVGEKGIQGIVSEYLIASCLGQLGSPDAPLVHCPELDEFYRYDPGSGVYKSFTKPQVERVVRELLTTCAEACDGGTRSAIQALATTHIIGRVVRAIPAESPLPLARFARDHEHLHVGNGILGLRTLNLEPFSPERPVRSALPIVWDPDAPPPVRFFEFLNRMFPDPDDVRLALQVCAMALLGNPYQRIVLLTGAAGSGKSTLVKLLRLVVGPGAYGQLRMEHSGSRFESEAWLDKLLLAQLDATPEILQRNTEVLKALSGHDPFTGEVKGERGRLDFVPRALPVITANKAPRVRLDGDADAWERRLVLLQGRARPTGRPVRAFEEELVSNEGPGILRVIAETARDLISAGQLVLSPRQESRVRVYLGTSEPVTEFVRLHVAPAPGENLYTGDAYPAAVAYLAETESDALSKAVVAKDFAAAMREVHNVRMHKSLPPRANMSTKGWRGFELV